MNIGQKIRYYRQMRNITQKDLAKKVCYDPSLINRIEKGWATPNPDVLNRILEVLNLKSIILTEEDVNELTTRIKKVNTLIENRHFDEASSLVSELEETVSNSLEPELEILFNIFKARLYINQGRKDAANALLKTVAIHKSAFTWEHSYFFNYIYGIVLFYLDHGREGLRHLTEAFTIGEKNKQFDHRLYYALSNANNELGYLSSSIMYGLKALQLAMINGTESYVFETKIILALDYSWINEPERAIELFQNCLYQLNNESDPVLFYYVYHNLGCTLLRAKKLREAEKALIKAFEYIDDTSLYFCINSLYCGMLYMAKKNVEAARKWLDKGLGVAHQYNYERICIPLNAYKYMWFADKHEAVKILEDSVLPSLVDKDYVYRLDFYHFLMAYYENEGRYKSAYQYAVLLNKLHKRI